MKLKKEVKIGLFGVAMLLVLLWGINFLKGKDIFVSTRTYYTTFDKADGLKPSTEIRIKGLKIGSVTGIHYNPLYDKHIVVEFTVGTGYKIPVDSRIVAYNTFIVGGTVLNLEYGGSDSFFEPHDTIPSVGAKDAINMITTEVEEIKDRTYILMEKLNTTFDNVNNLLNEENISNLNNTLKHVNDIVGNDIREITQNLNSLSKTLNDNTSKIENIVDNVEEFSDSLAQINVNELVGNMNTAIAQLNDVLEKVNEGEGTVSKLINDTALYDSLVTASSNLGLLLEDIKAKPGRYVRFSVFGKKDK